MRTPSSLPFAAAIAGILSCAPIAHARPRTPASVAAANVTGTDSIAAIVNGQLLTRQDVEDRTRLFVISTGLPISPSVVERLKNPIMHQMIIEKLKTQEILKRHINLPPEQIAASIANIEERNGMPKGGLTASLLKEGISPTTLIDQIRAQLGWMIVLRQDLGAQSRVTPLDIKQRERALSAQVGMPQYLLSEIFIHARDMSHADKELKLAQTIIAQLRGGAPFPIVAAQFSESSSALNGGAMGWVQEDHLDDSALDVIRKMPVNAISNPIPVPGGFLIATVHAKRAVGKEMGTLLTLRQAFFPFTSTLNPHAPTLQQQEALKRAGIASATLKTCDEVERLNQSLGEKKPSDPGTQLLERLPPQMQEILQKLPTGKSSHPLVAPDGIDLLMICRKEERNLAQLTPGQIADQLMNERIEQAARTMQRSLERHAVIRIQNEAYADTPVPDAPKTSKPTSADG